MEIQFEGEGFSPPKHGLVLLQMLIASLFFIFLLRTWYLQILEGSLYKQLAQENRYREAFTYASRGFIFDKNNKLLAGNKAAYSLAIVREDIEDIDKTLIQISKWTGIALENLKKRYEKDRRRVKSFSPLIIVSDISFEKVAQIEARLFENPGIKIIPRPRRFYPERDIFAHLLGYVAEANEKEMEKDSSLKLGDFVGKQGLELKLEERLRGQKGLEQQEVDAFGRRLTQRMVATPIRGENIQLSIDLNLQRKAWDLLENKRATIIVMEPETGKINAFVSRPAYDNNVFTRTLSMDDWIRIRDDEANPLHNRGIQGAYPPASIWKIPMATMLLEKNVSPEQTVHCSGKIDVGNQVFRCWKDSGHGSVNMKKAIVVSCDVYFYTMAGKIGIRYFANEAKEYGFGSKLGILLPYEHPGLIPTPEWKLERFKRRWLTGETINFSIGQGYSLITPLQAVSFLSGLLNDGVEMKPSLLQDEEPEVLRVLPIKKEYRDLVLSWMVDTVEDSQGTATRLKTKDVLVGGKTGTAQVTKLRVINGIRVKASDLPIRFRDHAWVLVFAEKDKKKYAIVVLVEHGGGGGTVAAPIAKQIAEFLFEKTHVDFLPEETIKNTIFDSNFPSLKKENKDQNSKSILRQKTNDSDLFGGQ
ncbi:MAG: penicillin-binding protein 2 [Desulfovibrionaceae bacterium]